MKKILFPFVLALLSVMSSFGQNVWNGTGTPTLTNGSIGVQTTPTAYNHLHISTSSNVQGSITLDNTSSGTTKFVSLSNYGTAGQGTYWGSFGSDNSASLHTNVPLIVRSTNGLYFSASSTGEHMRITSGGNVGIGTTSPGSFKLAVEGKIGAREINVTTTSPWPDYVFEETHNLKPLSEVESFIKANKHLPEIPSASEVKANGINLGEMEALLLKKVEELTLYTIEINKKMQEMINDNQALKNKNEKLEERIHNLEN